MTKERDLDKEKAFYDSQLKAHNGGDAMATANLGVCYQYGIGVKEDQRQAFLHYEKAYKAGFVHAANHIGAFYLYGTGGVKEDKNQAFLYFEIAYNRGFKEAAINLGYCYQFAMGVKQDKNTAFKLFEEAHKNGNVVGTKNLGICYRDGIGVTPDNDMAEKLFKEAKDKEGVNSNQPNLPQGYDDAVLKGGAVPVQNSVYYDWKFKAFSLLAGGAACAIGAAIYKGAIPKVDLSSINNYFYRLFISLKDAVVPNKEIRSI